MKKNTSIYIALFLIICLFPSAGLLFAGIDKNAGESWENQELAPAPQLAADNRLNPNFLKDAGTWFEDHFAFRDEAITAYALLLEKGFGVSAQERVITGKDGWLFYKDSLADFQGTAPMSERQLFDTAHSLAMIQEYARQHGAAFAFAAAPNKNSLYGTYMPDYYQPSRQDNSNLKRLKKYLLEEQVAYIDLYEYFQKDGRVLYHKTDSHWNNEGAALAAGQILDGLGREHASYEERPRTVRADFQGDLAAMLYPAASFLEENIYYDPGPQFSYCEDIESNFAPKINTISNGSGNLVMYRDSFGNALLPFLAEAFEHAYFSRALPYRLQELAEHEADALIIERAERFLPDMAQQAPAMEAPAVDRESALSGTLVKTGSLKKEPQGEWTQITGTLPLDMLQTRSRIYILLNGENCYEAFPVSLPDGQEGFSLLIRTEILQKQPVIEAYISEQPAQAARQEPSEQTDTQPPGEHDGKKAEIRREDYPDCDGSGHGYREIYYSDGSVVIEEY